MLIKAASHLRPILRLPFVHTSSGSTTVSQGASSAASSAAASSSSSASTSASASASASGPFFTSNATLGANTTPQGIYAAVSQQSSWASNASGGASASSGAGSGAGAGTGSGGYHAGSSRFGYTGFGRSLSSTSPAQTLNARKDEDDGKTKSEKKERGLREDSLRRLREKKSLAYVEEQMGAAGAVTRRREGGAGGKRFNEAGPTVAFVELEGETATSPRTRHRLLQSSRSSEAEQLTERGEKEGARNRIESGASVRARSPSPSTTRRSSFAYGENLMEPGDDVVFTCEADANNPNNLLVVPTSFTVSSDGRIPRNQLWTVGIRSSNAAAPSSSSTTMVLPVTARLGRARTPADRIAGFASTRSYSASAVAMEDPSASSSLKEAAKTPLATTGTVDDLTHHRASSSGKTTSTGRPRSQSTSDIISPSRSRSNSRSANKAKSTTSTSPEDLKQVEETVKELQEELRKRDSQWHKLMINAIRAGDADRAFALAHDYRNPIALTTPEVAATSSAVPPPFFTAHSYNLILSAYLRFRQPGEPINNILQCYNEMLEREILPNIRTYGNVILALLTRDDEITLASKELERQRKLTNWWKKKEQVVGHTVVAQVPQFKRNREESIQQQSEQLDSLKAENNFESAIKIMQAAITFNRHRPFLRLVYLHLLNSIAAHNAPDELATQVWEHLEVSKSSKAEGIASDEGAPMFTTFAALIDVYSQSKNLDAVQEVFKEALDLEIKGEVYSSRPATPYEENGHNVRSLYISVLKAFLVNGATEKYNALLSTIESTTLEQARQPGSPPTPTPYFYFILARSLVEAGQVDQAIELFGKAMQAGTASKDFSWVKYNETLRSIIDNLLETDQITTLIELYDSLSAHQLSNMTGEQIRQTLVAFLATNPDVTTLIHSINSLKLRPSKSLNIGSNIIDALAGKLLTGSEAAEALLSILAATEGVINLSSRHLKSLRSILHSEVESANELQPCLDILAKYAYSQVLPDAATCSIVVSHLANTHIGSLDESSLDSLLYSFDVLATAINTSQIVGSEAATVDDNLESLLTRLAEPDMKSKLRESTLANIAAVLQTRYGNNIATEKMTALFGSHAANSITAPSSPALTSQGSEVGSQDAPSTAPTSVGGEEVDLPADLKVRTALGRAIDGHCGAKATITPQAAYMKLKEEFSKGFFPAIQSVGRLIQSLGRLGDEGKVRELYALAHAVLARSRESDSQMETWLFLEDQMLVACCYLGNLEEAGLHRSRIIEHGGAPSADAYATMISNAKDTTDDASVARELFEESQRLGVVPHLYLYNTIISKLSRARKAEAAIELFNKMKAEGIRPSSVTYGAVIVSGCVGFLSGNKI